MRDKRLLELAGISTENELESFSKLSSSDLTKKFESETDYSELECGKNWKTIKEKDLKTLLKFQNEINKEQYDNAKSTLDGISEHITDEIIGQDVIDQLWEK